MGRLPIDGLCSLTISLWMQILQKDPDCGWLRRPRRGAIWCALHKAKKKGMSKIHLFLDAMEVIKAINGMEDETISFLTVNILALTFFMLSMNKGDHPLTRFGFFFLVLGMRNGMIIFRNGFLGHFPWTRI